MATYNSQARGLLFNPVTDTSINYYICLVDIPTAWGNPKFGAGVFSNGSLTYTADIAFPTVAGQDPGNNFVTCLLPVFTDQVGLITQLVIQGNTPNGIKKTGQVNNSKPVIRAENGAATGDIKALAARAFVIQSSSDSNAYFVGAFVLTPDPGSYSGFAVPFKTMLPSKTETDKLICELQKTTSITGPVTAFGCIPSTKDQFVKVKAKDAQGAEGDPGDFDYSAAISL
jgi:hypothetical protein